MNRHFSKNEFICFRPLLVSDHEQFFSLQQKIFPVAPPVFTNEDLICQKSSLRIMVAVSEGRVVGFAASKERPRRFWTSGECICVLPEFRDKGIGRCLLDILLLRQTRPMMRVLCRPSNERALALFRTGGFKDMGVRKRNYPDGEDAIILMKWLGF